MISRIYYILKQRMHVMKKKNEPCMGKVYMFHRVGEGRDTYSIGNENFRMFLEYLKKEKQITDLNILTIEKDDRNVVLTFDDVSDSVFHNAYPVLKELNVPYYLCLCDEFLDRDGYLSCDMVRQMMKDSKVLIASHGLKHELSRFKGRERFEEELSLSKEDLEEEFNVRVDAFAFPYGSMYACSKQNIESAKKYFNKIMTTIPLPYNEEDGNVIPRININDQTFRKEMQ